jgi:hypothetical protein
VELGHDQEIPEDATSLNAALESMGYTKRKLSQEAEGFREMARRFWNFVSGLVSQAWEAFMRFVEAVFSTLGRENAKNKELIARIGKIEGKQPTKDKVSTGTAGKYLTSNGKAPNKFADANDALNEVERLLSSLLDKHSSEILGLADDLDKVFTGFKTEESEKALAEAAGKARAALRNSSVMGILPKPGSSDDRYKKTEDGIEVKMSAPLPGGKFLVAHLPTDDATSAKVRSANFAIVDNPKFETYKAGDIDVLTPADLKKLVGKCAAVLRLVADYRNGKSKKLKDASDKLKQSSKRCSETFGKAEATPGQKENYQDLLRYQTAFATWATQPMGRACELSLRVVKAAQAMIATHIAAYPVDKE